MLKFEGKPPQEGPVEEFMALAKLFGYSEETLESVKNAISKEKGVGLPHLTRYYNPNPSRVKELEDYACELFGSRFALGVNSGTSALNTAYVACSIGPGDEVIVPGYTFFATTAAVVTTKAIPIIAEVDETLCIDPDDVRAKISPRTKAIVCVHMSGNVCDMGALSTLADEHGIALIEDNAQACGGKFKGRFTGSVGTMGCFSLSTYKITGAGEAGLVLTDDEKLYTRAQNQHDTAACWRPDRYAVERQPGELFCGQNYRMSELEGAINRVQLGKTAAQAQRYNRNMRAVLGSVDEYENIRPRPSNDIEGDVGYNLIFFGPSPRQSETIIEALREAGIRAGGRGSKTSRDWHIYPYWEHIMEQKTATEEGCPFTCPYYKAELPKYSPDMCPKTVDLLARAVFIPIDQWWTQDDCRRLGGAVNKVFASLDKTLKTG